MSGSVVGNMYTIYSKGGGVRYAVLPRKRKIRTWLSEFGLLHMYEEMVQFHF